MSTEVIVAFSGGKEYEFRVLEADLKACTQDEARRWLDDEWTALECEPTHPMGKVLLLDRILGVAKYGGERRFAENGEWARTYARNVSVLMGRPAVRVDVAASIVG